jgi:gliding motility-associated-like protein
LTVTPSGSYSSITWFDGSSEPSYQSTSAGTISFIVSGTSGCSLSDEFVLTVHENPRVDLGPDTTVCDLLTLDAGNDGVNYTWSTGDIGSQITIGTGAQVISVEVENEYNCIDRDTIQINECDIEATFDGIPNAITPNGDGKNDEWIIDELEAFPDVVVEIYDRWGRLVYRSQAGYPSPWDGRNMNGDLVPTGSYHYVLMLNRDDMKQVSGALSVIK